MTHLQTFEQYHELDEAFLGIKNKEEKTSLLCTKMKALLKYFINKNNSKNLNYWLKHLTDKSLNEMKKSIESYYDRLIGTNSHHVFGSPEKGGFDSQLTINIEKNPSIYDEEIKKTIEKLGFDNNIICPKLEIK
jgi:hypothetical protein